MKVIYFLFLAVFVVAVGGFAVLNNKLVEVSYVDQTLTSQSQAVSFPALVGVTYLLGMFSGWTVVGLVRRSFRKVTETR